MPFFTPSQEVVPSVNTHQMREVDRIAEEVYGLSIFQMMENAGRNVAQVTMQQLSNTADTVTILAGGGGNGGGGLCCARHLQNRGMRVHIVLDRPGQTLQGAAKTQWHILQSAGVRLTPVDQVTDVIQQSSVVVDAIIGYSLQGKPRETAAKLIQACNQSNASIISLDIPSGMNATTGETYGVVIHPDILMTLAAPKTGLSALTCPILLTDIGIPPQLYEQIGIMFPPVFRDGYLVPINFQDEVDR